MKRLLIFFVAVYSFTSISQEQIGHDLTVFSEDGLKFKMYVNEQLINEEFKSSVTVENTPHNTVSVRIEFEDESIPTLEKKYVSLEKPGTDQNKPPQAATYVIVKTKKGEYKIRFRTRSDKKVVTNTTIIINN